MPNSQTLLTTSWDDGHPLDMRLADLLEEHGIPATFYIPRSNTIENLPVITEAQVRGLSDRGFEIGAHTLDHTPLTTLDDDEARRQIVESKRWVEGVTGKSCRLFCPPRGWFNARHVEMIAQAGFEGFRTVELWSTDLPRDVGPGGFREMPTSVHARSYGLADAARNLAKRRVPGNVWRFLRCGITGDWTDQAVRLLNFTEARGGCFHLWGHSWEFESERDWNRLDRILRVLARRIRDRQVPMAAMTNKAVLDKQ